MLTKTLQDLFKRYRRPGDIVFAVVFLLFSLFLLSQLGEQTQVVNRTKWFAQPSLWPRIAIYCMVVFAILHMVSSAVSPRIPGRWPEVIFWLRSLEYVAYFLIYVIMVPWIGYLPSTVLFAVFLAIRVGFRNKTTLMAAVAFGVVVPVIFRAGLQVRVPAGAVYEYLPDSIRIFFLTNL
ncbi:tripartite tricarboxylate transporter TctB family protein [Cochlodiniinecator piscidefendens]|uniref:tripartite tricarboxylate transporter TctB family protein n=1 Tax=Cochlodiniinecator piscidefendens TaxID=2715756 RepID=UPI0014099FA9|nr:tripartite tricarboxylate transporter TctB family protein [Cochlodiniinecator piscidefendens]